MNRWWKIRILFLASIFLPFIAIAFLPWWLSVPTTILFIFIFIGTLIKGMKYVEEEKEKNNGC
jgi:hypothetical protein